MVGNRIDPVNKLCIGCERTQYEINKWPYLTDSQKSVVLKEIDKR